ncbi:hypothetical protein ACTHQ4_12450 [Alkalicoccobacillus gibsonii]|uniref:hypothetical protein n=1 Tax=Alkalicoccobacillus gibsonii TaxID=79881 RepID=UPI003F7B49B0
MKTKSNHLIVFVLPVVLMLVMGFGGYAFLQSDEASEWTNEDLQGNIEWTGTQAGQTVELSWEWPGMPVDGMFGDDYLSVVGPVEGIKVELHASDGILLEEEGTEVDNGWIVSFPTELVENKSYGNRGTLIIDLESSEASLDELNVQLLHTWTQHAPLEKEDATFDQPTFGEATNVPYWVEPIQVAQYVR